MDWLLIEVLREAIGGNSGWKLDSAGSSGQVLSSSSIVLMRARIISRAEYPRMPPPSTQG